MKLNNFRKLIDIAPNEKVIIKVIKEAQEIFLFLKAIYRNLDNGVVKMQILASDEPIEFPVEMIVFFSLESQKLFKIKYEELYGLDVEINSIHLFDKEEKLDFFVQVPHSLFIIKFNETFCFSYELKKELINYFRKIGATYSSEQNSFYFPNPISDIYQYIQEKEIFSPESPI